MDMMQDYLDDPSGFRALHAGADTLAPSAERK
jgi:hypothetical protein